MVGDAIPHAATAIAPSFSLRRSAIHSSTSRNSTSSSLDCRGRSRICWRRFLASSSNSSKVLVSRAIRLPSHTVLVSLLRLPVSDDSHLATLTAPGDTMEWQRKAERPVAGQIGCVLGEPRAFVRGTHGDGPISVCDNYPHAPATQCGRSAPSATRRFPPRPAAHKS